MIHGTINAVIDCTYAHAAEQPHHVSCSLGLYGGNPHSAMCKVCPQRRPREISKLNIPSQIVKKLPDSAEIRSLHALAISKSPQVQGPKRSMPSELQINKALVRLEVCKGCSHHRGHSTIVKEWPVYTVSCGICGCSGLSLIKGTCRANKWPVDDEVRDKTSPIKSSHIPKGANDQKDAPQSLLLKSRLSPGDIVMLSAAIRDLHRAYPNRFLTAVETPAMELWEHNPLIQPNARNAAGMRAIDMHYPLINSSNQRPYHFIHGYIQFLEQQLQLSIPVTEFKGDIYLSDEEKRWTNQVEETFGFKGPFWILVAGGKSDFTAKWWSPDYFQQVVNHFQGRIQFVQCGQKEHWHPALKGALNLVGKTSLRQFVRLMYHARGVISPVTLAMHLAAAVPSKNERLRPCVVVAGGREPPHWESYPGHQFLHTIGALPCCATGGCWRNRCQKMGDGDRKDQEHLCERPISVQSDLVIPQCMAMIHPQDVIRSVERYLNLEQG